jgi:propionyl-CoA carboxylase alpha chain
MSAHLKRNTTISGQLPGHEYKPWTKLVVKIGKEAHRAKVNFVEGGWDVDCEGELFNIRTQWRFGEPLYQGTINGEPFCMQVEQRGLIYRIFHWGMQIDAAVMSERAFKLLALMPEKVAPDMSRFLLSPMPGLLTQVAVSEGQEVKAGEVLAKIEAMKMENVLKAERDCVVDKIMVKPGESLSVDQTIIAFR